MRQPDIVEFYLEGEMRPMLIMESSIVPTENSLISIKGETYTVVGVSYAIDYSDSIATRQMRANIILKKRKGK